MDFTKYQALGNDYLLLDPGPPLTPAAVRLLCDRRLGVGADGVLLLDGPVDVDRPVAVRTVNADGSPCARSANGVRMVGLHLAGLHPGTARFTVATPAGESAVEVTDAAAGLVSVGLGPAAVSPPRPLAVAGAGFDMSFVDNGNPHAVLFLPEVGAGVAHEHGEAVAASFPGRANVQFVHVLGPDRLRVEVYERGAGYTPASGASACAAASAAHARGLTGGRVAVLMPGGSVAVEVGGDGVRMAGEVRKVFEGRISAALRRALEEVR
ncbi:diaminopimelate epimerase [Actinokineospora guangxiensis]|uniref:Diaminopimelate epimerase n=1 Tax=Actinokineospora guangxiensis TaxID=1490288 RepID=A0ABW0EVF5_9PSEU